MLTHLGWALVAVPAVCLLYWTHKIAWHCGRISAFSQVGSLYKDEDLSL